jgi:3',5'-cyclic-AMP phosphodiesterase
MKNLEIKLGKKSFNLLLITIILLFSACEYFEYNSNEIRINSNDKNTIEKNISKLHNEINLSDTICFAVMGDAQRWYDESTLLVDYINKIPEVDFVIQTGDLTDFGLPQEYNWMKNILDQLNTPYFPVIGNHDLVGNGGAMYKEMYGEFNFSFTYGNTKFVFLNTNSLEFGYSATVPNISWLHNELSNTGDFENVFLTMHVPPMSEEFNQNLIEDFKYTLNESAELFAVLHGHTHNFQITEDVIENIPLIGADAVDKKAFLLYKIIGNEISYEKIYL